MTKEMATTGNGRQVGGETMGRLIANLRDIRIRLAQASGPVELVLGATFAEDPKARALVGAIEAYNADYQAEGLSYRVDSARLVLALELISGA